MIGPVKIVEYNLNLSEWYDNSLAFRVSYIFVSKFFLVIGDIRDFRLVPRHSFCSH